MAGGESLYAYAPNAQAWVDILGLQINGIQDMGFSAQAANNLHNQAMNTLATAKPLAPQARKFIEGTTATQLSGNLAAIADIEGSIGYGASQNKEGKKINVAMFNYVQVLVLVLKLEQRVSYSKYFLINPLHQACLAHFQGVEIIQLRYWVE